jgi:prepilin-type N-terminal cleavage/methylation domain-containing protein
MSAPSPFALVGSPTLRRGRRGGFTLVEVIVTLVVLAVLSSIAVVAYHSVQRGQEDRAGFPILGIAQVDARKVASGNGLRFPAQSELVAAMHSEATNAYGKKLAIADVEDGEVSEHLYEVAVLRGSGQVAGFAVLASSDGDWDHCYILVDDIKGGKHHAIWKYETGTTQGCHPAVIVNCVNVLNQTGATGEVADKREQLTGGATGTPEDPYRPPYNLEDLECNPGEEVEPTPLDTVPCVVAEPSRVDTAVNVAWPPSPAARTKDVQYQVHYALDTGTPDTYDWKNLGTTRATKYTVPAGTLDNGKTYVFRVRPQQLVTREDGTVSVIQEDATEWVTSTRVTTIPSTMPIVAEKRDDGGVRLTFTLPAGITGYEITRAPDPLAAPVREDGAHGQQEFIDDGSDWEPGVRYSYRVTFFYQTAQVNPTAKCVAPARSLGEVSVDVDKSSNEEPFRDPLQAPAVTVENAPGGQGFNITFATVAGATKYLLRRSAATSPSAAAPTVHTSPLTETDAQPAGWDLLPSPAVNPAQSSVTVADPSAVAAPGSAQRLFAYQVGVVDAEGVVTWGKADAGLLAPGAPELTATPGGDFDPQIDLSWTQVPTALEYELYRSKDGTGTVLNPAPRTQTIHTDTAGLQPGTQYTYTVRATNRFSKTLPAGYRTSPRTVGGSALSEPASARTRLAEGSTTVTAGKPDVAEQAGGFVITWDPIANATSYTVYGSNTGAAGSYTAVSGALPAAGKREFIDRPAGGFAPGQTRFYKVVATAGSTTSELSADADFMPPAYPVVNAAVATPTTGAAATDVTLTATATPDVPGLELVVHNGDGTVMSPAPSDTDSSRAGLRTTLGSVPLSTERSYGVSASLTKTITVPASGDGRYEARTFTVTHTSAEAVAPADADGRTHTGGRTHVKVVTPPRITKAAWDPHLQRQWVELVWTKAGTVNSYKLERADRAAGTTVTGTSATDEDVQLGFRYTYRVTPVVPAGVATATSAPAIAMTPPQAPTLKLETPAGGGAAIQATVGRVNGGDGYLLVPKGAPVSTVLADLGGPVALDGKLAYFTGSRYATTTFPATASSATVKVSTGLALQTAYSFEAYAVNAAGPSVDGATGTQCTSPAAPTDPKLRSLELSGSTWSLASHNWPNNVTGSTTPAGWTFGNNVVLDVKTPEANRPQSWGANGWRNDPAVSGNVPCVTSLKVEVARTDAAHKNPVAKVHTVTADGSGNAGVTYFTDMSDNVDYQVKVTANGPGGSVSKNSITVKAPSRYDMVVAAHGPLRYYNFRPESGALDRASSVENCAKLTAQGLCDTSKGGDLKVWSAKNCPIAPLTGACSSGAETSWARSIDKSATVGLIAKGMNTSISPRDRAVTISRPKDVLNTATTHVFDDTFTWSNAGSAGYTIEAWVWHPAGSGKNGRGVHSGEVAGWGGRFCTQTVVKNWSTNTSICSGNHLGVGGYDDRISDFSTYVEGDALTGGWYVTNGMFAGGRLSPSLPEGGPSLNKDKHDRGGAEGANNMLKGGRWHLLHLTVHYANGRVRTQHYVDGRQTMEWSGSAYVFNGQQCRKQDGQFREIIDFYKAFQSCTTRTGEDTEANRYTGTNVTAKFERALRVGGLPRGNYLWYNGYNQMTSRWEAGERFHGFIDNVAVYRKVLTKAQMEKAYEAGKEIYNRTALPPKKS